MANLIPVFKSDKEMVENYRGILLLCIISKVLEKCVFLCVFSSSSRNFIIYKTALLRDAHVLLRSTFAFAKELDEKKQLDAVFLDYSKVFDSASFNCLLRELRSCKRKFAILI